MKTKFSFLAIIFGASLQTAAVAKQDIAVYDTITFQRTIKTLTINPVLETTEVIVESKGAMPFPSSAFEILNNATTKLGEYNKAILKTTWNNGRFVIGTVPPPSANHKFLLDDFYITTRNCMDKLAEDTPDKFYSIVAMYVDRNPSIDTVRQAKEGADRMVELYASGQCIPGAGNGTTEGLELGPFVKASLAGVLYNGEEAAVFTADQAYNVFGFVSAFVFGRKNYRDRALWTAWSSKLIEDRIKTSTALALPAYEIINEISEKRFANFINFLFEIKRSQASVVEDSFKVLGQSCFESVDSIFDKEFVLSKCLTDHDIKVRFVKAFGKNMIMFSKD